MNAARVLVGHDELGRFIRDVLVAHGARAADAAVVAEGLVWANLRGGDGHGVSRLPRYVKLLADGEIDTESRAAPDAGSRRDLRARLRPRLRPGRGDGGRGACRRTGQTVGVCFGAHSRDHAYRSHRPLCAMDRRARLRRRADGRGPALMAYHGARVASMGTSPIAIAVPSGNGPIVLDMATSTISNGKILQARATGTPLPQRHRADRGRASRPPIRKPAEILLPLGGPKGSGLALMFELLASVLAAAPIQARTLGPEKRTRNTGNTAMFVIDIASFRPLADYTKDADRARRHPKALPRQVRA